MDQAEYRTLKLLLEPCQTADELDRYLRFWLKLDLPWHAVDPESTSAPLVFLWSVYKTMLTGQGPHTHILASSRNCMKTLTSSAIQFLSMLHFRRDGAHIAATLDQSGAAINYLNQFLSIPELEPYLLKDNVKTKQLINLPPNDFTDKNNAKIQVVTATKKGANSPRATCITLDEVDLVPQQILDEAAYIGDVTRDKHRFNPVFIYLSSRKSNSGPVQNLLDGAEKNNNGDEKVHKWSSTDFMKVCAPEIHKPELGTRMAYVHPDTLRVIWGKEAFEATVQESARAHYKEYAAFEGCMTCPAFIPCFGFSAKQESESVALRTREYTASIVRRIKDPSTIVAQTLNWKPETSGLIYNMFSRFRHLKAPIDFYQWAVGEKYNPQRLSDEEFDNIEENGSYAQLHSITPSKRQTYEAMIDKGWTFVGGVDFGHSPDPAVTLITGYHKRQKRACVLTLECANGYSNHLWAEHACSGILKEFPVDFVAPDCVPDKAAPTYFGKFGVRSLDTKPSRIEPGVSFVRGLLWNPMTQSSDFAIFDDCETDNVNIMMVEAFEKWAHKKGPMGYDMHKFDTDGEHTHTQDALRYALDKFIEIQTIQTSFSQKPNLDGNLALEAAFGDDKTKKAAQDAIIEKNKIENILNDRMMKEFGVTKPFFEKKNADGTKSQPSKGGIKFRF